LVVLALTAIEVAANAGQAGLVTNTGPHGFMEILFAYAFSMANNGQSMAGLNANTVVYDSTTTMLAGRFGLTALALALAGRFAAQRRRPVTAGTLPSDSHVRRPGIRHHRVGWGAVLFPLTGTRADCGVLKALIGSPIRAAALLLSIGARHVYGNDQSAAPIVTDRLR
jgi:hypothetical protein